MNHNISNMIKQPAQCCIHCGKSYKKKTNLEKHVNLCELLNSKKTLIVEDEETIPSQRKIYQILLELGSKFNRLEEKVDELNRWVVKKKKKINTIEWLNTNTTPEIKFDNLIEKIIITDDDVKYLFKNSFYDTINYIFSRNIYNLSENAYPIFAFIQKTNIFYIYENEETKWIELTSEKLIMFLNKVHMKLFRLFCQHKKDNADRISEDEHFSILCDKTSLKLMNIDFRQEIILGKIRSNMYGRMKTEIKSFVEYEFEI